MRRKTANRKIHIGTSGWAYAHWQGRFYPNELPLNKRLEYYTKYLATLEVNSSFYHLPKESSFSKWTSETPKSFLFALKGWRRITHLKRLVNCSEDINIFLQRASIMGDKLGPILWQLPPSLKYDHKLMEEFISALSQNFRYTIEVRHESFNDSSFFDLLEKHRIAFCIADTPNYFYSERTTSDFVYLRLHGHEKLYASRYSDEDLELWATKLATWGKESFVYFDNDYRAYAIENALGLLEKVKLLGI